MKKIMVSLTAASLVFGASAFADVDFDVSGQAKVFYETNDAGENTLFGTDSAASTNGASSKASVGIQLNANADLGNGFGFGSQATMLQTWGLEKKLVGDTAQESTNTTTATWIPLTKLYLTKKIGNTTLKGGRQELPKSLSPLAFSEKWNVFKNTFDAIVGINSDIPDTTVVAAYVSTSNQSNGQITDANSLTNFNDLTVTTGLGNVAVTDGAYMLTVANTSIPLTAVTLSYYSLGGIDASGIAPSDTFGASAMWADVKVAGKELPVGLNIALQGGQISPDDIENGGVLVVDTEATTVMGAKAGIAVAGATVDLAYTTVNDGTVGVVNVGTGVKTPLYTQMVGNQGKISSDNSTIVVKAGYDMGDFGAIALAYDMTTDNRAAAVAEDYTELDVVYKAKAGGVQYFAAYVKADYDEVGATSKDSQKVRLWANYAF